MNFNTSFVNLVGLLWKFWRYLKTPKEVEGTMKRTFKDVQIRLKAFGFDAGDVDGKNGPKTLAAIKAFQKAHNLQADGKIGPLTLSALFPDDQPIVVVSAGTLSGFDKGSATRLAKAHPNIQKVMNAARKKVAFQVLDSQRGKAAQEKAFREGHSHAHFGQSAHNFEPAVAVDITPLPLNWKDIDSFIKLSHVILATAKELNIPLEWGGGWKSIKDYPHYELPKPWSQYNVHLIK